MRRIIVISVGLGIAACSKHPALGEDPLLVETSPAASATAPQEQVPTFHSRAQEARARHFWQEFR